MDTWFNPDTLQPLSLNYYHVFSWKSSRRAKIVVIVLEEVLSCVCAYVIYMKGFFSLYLNSLNTDGGLWQLLDGQRKEQGDVELDAAIEGHSDKDATGSDAVAKEGVDSECNKDNDLVAGEEGGYVESS